MKRSQVFHAAAAVLLFSACQKHIDIDPGQGLKFCRIVKLGLAPPQSTGDTSYPRVYISYNADANPTDMLFSTYPNAYNDVSLDYHFRYDRQGRLTDWIWTYVVYHPLFPGDPAPPGIQRSTNAILWYTFSYPRKDMVVDSEFAYGDMPISAPAPPQSSFEGSITVFQLDELGRIIKSWLYFASLPDVLPNPTFFNYDRQGNLIEPGITYDDKLNPYRTNSVWTFLNKDHSVNNPFSDGRSSYVYSDFNPIGLPQKITASDGGRFFYGFRQMSLTYDCSCNAPDLKSR